MFEDYKKILSERLDSQRYIHSLAVAKQSVYLAKKYGGDVNKCELAGLLHDITKNTSADEQLKLFSEFGIILSDVEKTSPKLWHALSGSVFIKEKLGIDDEEIIKAVRYHTTGKPDMNLLEKILFVADFTSEDRDYPDVGVIRNLSEKSLEEAMIYGLNYTIRDLCERNFAVHPDTVDAYNYLLIHNK